MLIPGRLWPLLLNYFCCSACRHECKSTTWSVFKCLTSVLMYDVTIIVAGFQLLQAGGCRPFIHLSFTMAILAYSRGTKEVAVKLGGIYFTVLSTRVLEYSK